MEPISVVIQCFAKTDTLKGLLDSLLGCEGHRDVDLTIWQDSAYGSRREEEFTGAATEVHAFVIDFISEHGRRFRTLDYRLNERNLGPYGTCKVALDHAFSKHEFAILIEDDILLSSDALLWFDKVYRLGLLHDGRNWAIAGQSIFFDSRGRDVDQDFVATASRFALEQNLVNQFTVHQFVPSACFATTRRWWAEFRSTRGEPRGDVLLCNRTKEEGWGCVFPIVPRAKDVGMLHDYGFSVTIHSKDGVQAITTPYLTSEALLSERAVRPSDLEQFEGDAGLLFRQTTLLEGYSPGKKAREQVATAASDAKDWGRAAALWNALREEFPEEPRYWLKAGEALCEAKTIEAAERLLDEAVRLFPQHNWLAYRHVRVAHQAGKWGEAVARSERLRKEAPEFWPGWVAGVDALAMLRRGDEAKDLALRAVSRFPDEFWPNYWLARLRADGDPQGALHVWTELVSRFPEEPVAAAALKSASGKAPESETIFDTPPRPLDR